MEEELIQDVRKLQEVKRKANLLDEEVKKQNGEVRRND